MVLLTSTILRTLAFVGVIALIKGVAKVEWVFVGFVASLLIGLAPKRLVAPPPTSAARSTDGTA